MSRSLFRVSVVVAALVLGVVFAQNVGALRGGSWDLPRNDSDRLVINAVFDVLDAVQVECSASLKASLAQEGAYAACGRYDVAPHLDDIRRSRMGYINTRVSGRWVTAWRDNREFGVVRELEISRERLSYSIALDEANGVVYVIRFEQ